MSTKPPAPFNLPKFSFNASATEGNAPLLVMFQPLVKSSIATYYWDFEGIGRWQESSNGPIAWEYSNPGTYTPSALADFPEEKTEASHTGDPIVVTPFKPELLDINLAPTTADCYSSWHKACRIKEGDRFVHQISNVAIYKFSCHAHGLYQITLDPIGYVADRGLVLEVKSETGRVKARSGGKGSYGRLILPLQDNQTHQIWVKGSGPYSIYLKRM